MSKKEEAFELFAQGKGPKDPEVADLGLKKESQAKYYRLWLNNKPEPKPAVAVPVTRVPLSAIKDGEFFALYGGSLYKRDNADKRSELICVRTAAYVAGGACIDGVSIRVLKPDIMVTPK